LGDRNGKERYPKRKSEKGKAYVPPLDEFSFDAEKDAFTQ
jgi:hypothetical protein